MNRMFEDLIRNFGGRRHRYVSRFSGMRWRAYYNRLVRIAKHYILVSDDVRTEATGKLIVIGLYDSGIKVSKLPVVMPLAFTASIEIEGSGSFAISGNLRDRDSGDVLLNFGAKGDVRKSGSALVPFKFPAVQFDRAGIYEVSLALEGQPERVAETFEVSVQEDKKVLQP